MTTYAVQALDADGPSPVPVASHCLLYVRHYVSLLLVFRRVYTVRLKIWDSIASSPNVSPEDVHSSFY